MWNDNAEFHAQKWFENLPEEARFTPAAKTIARTIQAVARQHAYHPVRDYLGGLRWDGNARLERWLTTYLKAQDTPYTRAVGARWLISAVARVYKPGCQADYMLVLEGKQGRQKSKALRSLCPDVTWFTDYIPNHANKDAAMQCKGAWIIEDAELRATKTSQQDASKSFQTRRVDKFRPPYGRYTIQSPRHCVMAGTVNPPSDGRYLKDSTGNRRYWPVAVADNIDVENLERDRNQLWAEAVKRFREGMPWWLETAELEAMAEAEQAKRVAINDLHDEVISWLEALPLTGKNLPNQSDVSVTECLNGIFGQERHHSRSDEIKVANILKNNGYRRYRPNREGIPRTPRYRKCGS